MNEEQNGVLQEQQGMGIVPPVHPAVAAKRHADMQTILEENEMLKEQLNGMKKQYEQDVTKAHNVGRAIGAEEALSSADRGIQMDPIEALYDGIGQGATLEDMAQVGMVQDAIDSMYERGAGEEDVSKLFAELQQLEGASANKDGDDAYRMGSQISVP